jgi:predicted enzyme related to lactoylglutathione lyase
LRSTSLTFSAPLIFLYGSNLEDIERSTEAAPGKIVKSIFEFPGDHRFHFTDPDGYELAVWSET